MGAKHSRGDSSDRVMTALVRPRSSARDGRLRRVELLGAAAMAPVWVGSSNTPMCTRPPVPCAVDIVVVVVVVAAAAAAAAVAVVVVVVVVVVVAVVAVTVLA